MARLRRALAFMLAASAIALPAGARADDEDSPRATRPLGRPRGISRRACTFTNPLSLPGGEESIAGGPMDLGRRAHGAPSQDRRGSLSWPV